VGVFAALGWWSAGFGVKRVSICAGPFRGVEELDTAQAIHPISSLQFSLWERGPVDSGALAWCRHHGAAFSPFSPLGRGFLTGKVTADTITDGDARASHPRFTPEAMEQNFACRAGASRGRPE
jgi:aryl-alcohol dehydrogenase-like predicted oxidoreductase